MSDNVDPVKVNLTLSAAAQALTGLGDKFGQSIVNGNKILDDLNPRMPTIRHDIHQLAALGDIYAKAAPDLFDALENAVTTARTLNRHQAELDAALLAAIGFANTGNDIFTRSKPYLERLTADLLPTAHLLDTYSPQVFCTIRNFADIAPKVAVAGERQPLRGATRGGHRRHGEPVRLSGQLAENQRPRRTRRQAGLLAADHPRSVAGAVPGDGLRQQHCALQPLRAQPAAGQRIRVGAPVRGEHDQPMRLTGTVVRLAAVVAVQLLFTAIIVVVFGQVRFDRTNSYSAEFSNASGLRAGQFVRASGVEVGKVKKVDLVEGDKKIRVDFSVDRSVQLYQSTTAQIRYQDLIGNRYLELSRGSGEGAERTLPPGGFIPLSRTQPALDLDALIGGFKPLFRALDPQKVNTIASSIITVFQGEGGTINDILDQTAQLTDRLAESDQAIGEVITNLNTVLDTTVRHRDQFDATIDKFDVLITGLKDRADPARRRDRAHQQRGRNGGRPAGRQPGAGARDGQPPGNPRRAHSSSSATGSATCVGKVPAAFNIIGRASGIYGDFFNFYLCDLSLKVNGLQPGGPVRSVKLFQQPIG